MTFFQQLRRRKVIRTAIAYLAGVWLVLQVADTILPYLGAPEWIMLALIFASAVGFPFVLVLSWKYDLTSEGLQSAEDQSEGAAPALSNRRLDILIYTMMSIAIVVLVVDNYILDQFSPVDRRSIAVLPLANLTPGAENDSFTGGMHDEILSSLASIGSLKVISRTSVLAYRDTTKNLRQIAQELGVATILEGTVRRSVDTVRIDVQLIDAETDEQIWSEEYDRSLSVANILAIQGDIARMVSYSLHAALTSSEADQLDVIPTENLQAYEYYLAGTNLVSAALNMEYLRLARGHFEQAVAADPEFALAWVALADTLVWLSQSEAGSDAWQMATDALERAESIQARLPEADIVRGHMASLVGDHAAAIEYLVAAEELIPGNARLHRQKGRAYMLVLNLEESIVSLERAISIDPRDPLARAYLARVYGKLRNHDLAESQAQSALDFNPDCNYCRWSLGAMRLYRGDDSTLVFDALIPEQEWSEETDWRSFEIGIHAHMIDRNFQKAGEVVDAWERFLGHQYPPGTFDEYRALLISLERGPEAAAPMYRGLLERAESILAEDPDNFTGARIAGESYAWLGHRDAAIAAAQRFLGGEVFERGPLWDFWISDDVIIPTVLYMLAPIKESDLALATLDEYFSGPGNWSIESLSRHPLLEYLQDDPRWQAMYEKYRR